jgi:hypothetical protein
MRKILCFILNVESKVNLIEAHILIKMGYKELILKENLVVLCCSLEGGLRWTIFYTLIGTRLL